MMEVAVPGGAPGGVFMPPYKRGLLGAHLFLWQGLCADPRSLLKHACQKNGFFTRPLVCFEKNLFFGKGWVRGVVLWRLRSRGWKAFEVLQKNKGGSWQHSVGPAKNVVPQGLSTQEPI